MGLRDGLQKETNRVAVEISGDVADAQPPIRVERVVMWAEVFGERRDVTLAPGARFARQRLAAHVVGVVQRKQKVGAACA